MVKKAHEFRLIQTCPGSKARAGELVTPHGTVPTPVFMPVGSQATVKTLSPDDLEAIGVPMILANTYHLYLRPGVEVIEKFGGVHRFMGWNRPVLTDSGGFQVFSLAPLRKVSDEGVVFRSHIDGSEHHFTPELAIRLQETIGADVIMVLDECTAHDESRPKVEAAMRRTHHWAERCLRAKGRSDQALYAIVQGGFFPELRHRSAEYLTSLDFDGYAIGGLSVGEPKKVTLEMLDETVPLLPENRSRYLMGVGSPEDIMEGVDRGVDMFDCALPTRVARNGSLLTHYGRIDVRNAKYKTMESPVVPDCQCYTCRTFSAAYLNHLFRSTELLAYRLATIHNLHFMNDLMVKIREAILNSTFRTFKEDFLKTYQPTDEEVRLNQKEKWLKGRRGRG